MTDNIALEGFRSLVDKHVQYEMGRKYDPDLYPYGYAAEFVRTNWRLIPGHLRDQLGVMDSRDDALRACAMWAAELGIDDEEASKVLADAYLKENGVERVRRAPLL